MMSFPLAINRYRIGLSLLCILSLAALYLIVYSARIESGDSLRLLDVATSLVRHGDYGRDESLWFVQPAIIPPDMEYPLATQEAVEYFPVAVVSLFYRLGDMLPGIGYIQVVWLLNICLTALSGGVFFWLALVYGYSERTALIAAWVYGAATIVLPYSKTLFRETPVMFFLLLALFCLACLRRSCLWRGRLLWGMGAIFAAVAAFLMKDSAVMAFPALLCLILPLPKIISHQPILRYLGGVLLLFLVAALIVIVYNETIFNALAQTLFMPLGISTTYIRPALHTYLFSVGGSLWGTSPVLLLALPGLWWLWRHKQMRLIGCVLLAVIGYAAGHALLTDIHWFGGLSWPSRFMVPVVPIIMVAVLPVIDSLFSPQSPSTNEKISAKQRAVLRGFAWLIFAILLVYSLWIQFNAVALPWTHYLDLLPEGVPLEWSDGLNRLEFLRWVLLPGSWQTLGFDFAWTRAGVAGWLLFYGIFAFVWAFAAGICVWLRAWAHGIGGFIAITGLMFLLGLYGSLRQLYENDGLYYAQKTALHDVLHILEAEAQPGDVLLLADETYSKFMLNYNRLTSPRVITLPYQPGERASEKAPVLVEADNPVDLLSGDRAWLTPNVLDHVAMKHDRVWLLAHNGPYLPWAVRPVERFLSQQHYLLRVFETGDPTVRLLEYSLIAAPNPYDFLSPEVLTDLQFGESLRLEGYTLPKGIYYQAGDVLPISFYWRADAPLERDYVVAWFVTRADGTAPPIQGRDTPPYDGFAPTTTWQPGLPVWDNHALRLPSDLTAGEYRLWVTVYFYGDAGVERLPVTGAETLEGTIGVLPSVITITTP